MNDTVVLSGAEEDLFIHYCFQEECGSGRGLLLDASISHHYRLLAQNPFMGPRYHEAIRKLIMRDWDLGLYYAVEGSRNITLAVQNLRQNPKRIRALLKSRLPR